MMKFIFAGVPSFKPGEGEIYKFKTLRNVKRDLSFCREDKSVKKRS